MYVSIHRYSTHSSNNKQIDGAVIVKFADNHVSQSSSPILHHGEGCSYLFEFIQAACSIVRVIDISMGIPFDDLLLPFELVYEFGFHSCTWPCS